MADTIVEIECHPGTASAYVTVIDGTGVPAASYALTQVAGFLHRLTIAESVIGRIYVGAGNAAGTRGYRELTIVDEDRTYEIGNVTSSETLDAIKAIVSAIASSGSSTTFDSSEIVEVVRGDSYDGTANPLLSFTETTDYSSGWSGTFTVNHRVTGAELLSTTSLTLNSDSIQVSLGSSDTAFALLVSDDEFGPHPFDIELVNGSSTITAKRGVCYVRKDQTTA